MIYTATLSSSRSKRDEVVWGTAIRALCIKEDVKWRRSDNGGIKNIIKQMNSFAINYFQSVPFQILTELKRIKLYSPQCTTRSVVYIVTNLTRACNLNEKKKKENKPTTLKRQEEKCIQAC